MENALIIGASGGIGAALTEALSQTGVAVTGLSYDLIFVATGALEIEGARPERSI